MTTEEFSREFDILYNNITSNIAPPLNDYEKSVFLTQAQDTVVLSVYDGSGGSDSFEETEEATQYIRSLVSTASPSPSSTGLGITDKSYLYEAPKDMLFIIHETAKFSEEHSGCNGGSTVNVIPTTHDKLSRVINNPFRGATKRNILRLMQGPYIELISKYPVQDYKIRYLRKPKPIILTDLDQLRVELDLDMVDSLYIGTDNDGRPYTKRMECELNQILHRDILTRAVVLAKAIWNSGE